MYANSETQVILHVDDDDHILDLGALAMGQHAPGATTVRHGDADEALATLASTRVDCVVSDGVELADGTPFALAAREHDPTVPIVLFTAAGPEEVQSVAELVDAAGYVRKGDRHAIGALGRQISAALAETSSVHRRLVDDGWTVVAHHDWGTPGDLTERLVEAVQTSSDLDAETLPSLYDSVDADALDALLAPGSRHREQPVEVRLGWADHEVLVTDGGLVAVRPLDG